MLGHGHTVVFVSFHASAFVWLLQDFLRAVSYSGCWHSAFYPLPALLTQSSPLSYSLELPSSACLVPPPAAQHSGLLTAIAFSPYHLQKIKSKSSSFPHLVSVKFRSHGVIEVIYIQVWMAGVRENENCMVVKAVKTDYIRDDCSRGKRP